MFKREYMVVAYFIVWRAIQSLVVIPCSMIGALLVLSVLAGESPVKDTIYAVDDWAEKSVRPAPVGSILVTKCLSKNETKEITPPPLNCDSPTNSFISVADAASNANRILMKMYFTLWLFSLAVLILVVPRGQFFGVHKQTEDGYDAGCKERV